jgi:hypothetical protein
MARKVARWGRGQCVVHAPNSDCHTLCKSSKKKKAFPPPMEKCSAVWLAVHLYIAPAGKFPGVNDFPDDQSSGRTRWFVSKSWHNKLMGLDCVGHASDRMYLLLVCIAV